MAGTRLAIVASFVLFALLAAPFAWQLTQVERVALPSARILRLAAALETEGLPAPPTSSVTVFARTSATVELPPASGGVHYERRKLLIDPSSVGGSDAETDEKLRRVLGPHTTTMTLSVLLLCQGKDDGVPSLVMGKHRFAWTTACDIKKGDALYRALGHLVRDHLIGTEGREQEGTARAALQYRLQFTLLKESPETDWSWDFAALRERFLLPMTRKASVLADFSDEMQIAQYAKLARVIHSSDDGESPRYYLEADDLKQFKSANDFLSASVLADREQVLHFMAALPAEEHAPLVIRPTGTTSGRDATAFEIPGWGVVAILNTHVLVDHGNKAETREVQRVMGLFVSQFRRLIGAPSFHHRQQAERERAATTGEALLKFVPSTTDGITDWELDVIARARFQQMLATTIETLESTVKLVEEMTEMSVLERVEQRITTALGLLELILCVRDDESDGARVFLSNATCASQVRQTHEIDERLRLARQAAALADAAYYDHTMIRQLYFPQEQMLGVYAPLLAPLILPFFLGFVRETKRWKQKRKEKANRINQQKSVGGDKGDAIAQNMSAE